MSVKKTYLQSKPECKVTFKLEKKLANSANRANLVGEFNNWDEQAFEMKKLKTGDFTITLNLDKDKEYQFRYLIDSSHWINDPEADKHVPNVFQSENSVIVV